MSRPPDVIVAGAGLAGTEAALQLARRGVAVRIHERKPKSQSPASRSPLYAELVCSNSFRARSPENAVGLLKEEMKALGSFFIKAAELNEVPAGGALAVDRECFSAWLTAALKDEPLIEIVSEELEAIPSDAGEVILATGPLTGEKLATRIATLTGQAELYFYDAIAPVVEAASIDHERAFFASRYGKGGADYLNLPMNEEQYRTFVREIGAAKKVEPRPFEEPRFFEGCLPVDVMAQRGEETLRFGPMKPVGLIDPASGKQPFAAIQLRAENRERTAFSLVGFQTRLTHPEQLRIFRLIPGLERAEFPRLGSVHRNTFINAPLLLDRHLRLRNDSRISFAGQLAGVEGYVESAACGLMAALFTFSRLQRRPLPPPPPETMTGGMLNYLAEPQSPFQPSNVTHAMLPALDSTRRLAKRQRKIAYAERARPALQRWIEDNELVLLQP